MQKLVATLLLVTTLGLIALGLVMLASTSAMLAPVDMQAVYGNLRKQCVWLALGGVVCVFLANYDYQKLLPYAPWGVGLAALLLLLCFVPHVGKTINGSPRWIGIGGLSYQPSEFAKMALVVFTAWWMGKFRRRAHEFLRGFLYPCLLAAPLLFLIALEQDFGTTALLLVVEILMLFCAGTRLPYLTLLPLLGFTGLGLAVVLKPERMARILAWAAAGVDHGKGDQQYEGLISLGSGGVYGLGLGNSRQKWGFLPEVNTDFVFSIVGEELGLVITLAVVFCFLVLTLCGAWISAHAPDPSGVLLGLGVTSVLMLQALMNLAVVTSLIPCKGIPLPFISYGGSNLLTSLIGVGFLFNLQRQGVNQEKLEQPTLLTTSYSVRM